MTLLSGRGQSGTYGISAILRLALPLILSHGSWMVQQIVDRIFLSWLSPEAVAAAMPSGMMNWTIVSLFTGTTGYVSAFAAQFHGAKRDREIGPVVWQGLVFSVVAGLCVLPLLLLSPAIFNGFGHPPEVAGLERVYFDILLLGVFPAAASSALGGFFSGLGKTGTVMGVTFAATLANIALDYALVFGRWGFPAMGIGGAAAATVVSQCVSLAAYLVLCRPRSGSDPYGFRNGRRFESALFGRLLRFGFPNGFHYCLESSGFTLFLIIVGRYGTTALAATNIAFNINNLAFMPMIGFGAAASIRVGQKLGEDRPDLAERDTRAIFGMTFVYMAAVAAAYVLVPGLFIAPYGFRSDPARFAPVALLAAGLLKFVALYSLFDTANIVFAAAVKGAGDTRFVMWTSFLLSWGLMVLPAYFGSRAGWVTLHGLWAFATLYISSLGLAFTFRFMGGKWKRMRVIQPAVIPGAEMEAAGIPH
jgi:multidrug resistance protein, MATE family